MSVSSGRYIGVASYSSALDVASANTTTGGGGANDKKEFDSTRRMLREMSERSHRNTPLLLTPFEWVVVLVLEEKTRERHEGCWRRKAYLATRRPGQVGSFNHRHTLVQLEYY